MRREKKARCAFIPVKFVNSHHPVIMADFFSKLVVCCRTKALVLELLAAVCLVSGGHDIILAAFDNFKEVCALQQDEITSSEMLILTKRKCPMRRMIDGCNGCIL